jgi:hypothetical protein
LIFKKDNVIKRVVDAFVKALEVRRLEVVVDIIKVLTFYTEDEVTWSQIICRDVVRGCL